MRLPFEDQIGFNRSISSPRTGNFLAKSFRPLTILWHLTDPSYRRRFHFLVVHRPNTDSCELREKLYLSSIREQRKMPRMNLFPFKRSNFLFHLSFFFPKGFILPDFFMNRSRVYKYTCSVRLMKVRESDPFASKD